MENETLTPAPPYESAKEVCSNCMYFNEGYCMHPDLDYYLSGGLIIKRPKQWTCPLWKLKAGA